MRQQVTAELIMSLTEKECRSALLMLAYASTSLTGDEDDEDDDTGLNNIQAAIAEDAARTAIRAVLAETRGIAVPAPALEVYRRGVRSGMRRVRAAARTSRTTSRDPPLAATAHSQDAVTAILCARSGQAWGAQRAGPAEVALGVLAEHGGRALHVVHRLPGGVGRSPASRLAVRLVLRLGFRLAFVAALEALQPLDVERRLAIWAVGLVVGRQPAAALPQVAELENRVHRGVGPVRAAGREPRRA